MARFFFSSFANQKQCHLAANYVAHFQVAGIRSASCWPELALGQPRIWICQFMCVCLSVCLCVYLDRNRTLFTDFKAKLGTGYCTCSTVASCYLTGAKGPNSMKAVVSIWLCQCVYNIITVISQSLALANTADRKVCSLVIGSLSGKPVQNNILLGRNMCPSYNHKRQNV